MQSIGTLQRCMSRIVTVMPQAVLGMRANRQQEIDRAHGACAVAHRIAINWASSANTAPTMHYLAPTERFLRRTVLSLLLVLALGGVLASVLHLLQGERRMLDMILPPLLALVMFGLFVHLLRRPHALLPVIWVGAGCGVAGLAIPAWYYTVAAWLSPQGSLVDSLPPITALLVPLLLVLMVFLRPRHLLAIALGVWLLVAAPILVYLAAHPHEMVTPRGLDMMLALGPVTLMVVRRCWCAAPGRTA